MSELKQSNKSSRRINPLLPVPRLWRYILAFILFFVWFALIQMNLPAYVLELLPGLAILIGLLVFGFIGYQVSPLLLRPLPPTLQLSDEKHILSICAGYLDSSEKMMKGTLTLTSQQLIFTPDRASSQPVISICLHQTTDVKEEKISIIIHWKSIESENEAEFFLWDGVSYIFPKIQALINRTLLTNQ